MSKVAIFFTLGLVLSFTLIHASRPNSFFENGGVSRVEIEDEICEEGAEECLRKRTLAAHLDYIYTQNAKEGQHKVIKNKIRKFSMSKQATFFTFLLLLSFNLIHASRPNPSLNTFSSLHEAEVDGEFCEEETEECLMRRTLAAHVDYIYTQKNKPKP
ncbi:Phytosulfokines Phytosulfokine-alpha [Vigna angularis]|uniref:Phytosulfokine n=2 Tax=Phaseolus angularis TaxID=3914 RepID=A0A8T0JZN1_PHAAN|nr:Phytosulfokines Phytosulfokine-alpha [Vigna angularis]